MKTLYESLLGDLENNLSVTSNDIYPAPTIKDFYKNDYGYVEITWNCKNLIRNYLHILPNNSFKNLSLVDGFRIIIGPNIQEGRIFMIDLNYDYAGRDGFGVYRIQGIEYGKIDLRKLKKEIIEFFKAIVKNPDLIKKLFEYSEKCRKEIFKDTVNYSRVEHKTLREVLKF